MGGEKCDAQIFCVQIVCARLKDLAERGADVIEHCEYNLLGAYRLQHHHALEKVEAFVPLAGQLDAMRRVVLQREREAMTGGKGRVSG